MNLFDILSNGERIIVFSSEQDLCIYTWNQSLTLQCWVKQGSGGLLRNRDQWIETDTRVLSDTPASFEEAKKKAEKWYYDQCE